MNLGQENRRNIRINSNKDNDNHMNTSDINRTRNSSNISLPPNNLLFSF
jgi:hypothetical protein